MDNLETFDMSVTVESTIADREFMKSVAGEAMKLPSRPISEVIENMNTLNNNPMNYIVNENPPLEFTNRWYASGIILDTGNPTEDAKRAFQNYRGPNTASTGGIREQINTANVNFPQPLTQNDVVERIMDLCNQEPPQQFMDSMVLGTSRKKKAHADPSIIINEETGERFKWIDGKLVNLDEQDSTN